jgi:hypothetical protein
MIQNLKIQDMRKMIKGLMMLVAVLAVFVAEAATDPKKAENDSKAVAGEEPVIMKTDKEVIVSFLSEDYQEWEITIKDPYGRISYEGTLAGSDYVGKKFDFSSVHGNFEITLSSQKSTVKETVKI